MEVFILGPNVDVAAFRPALELGREFGGRRATTVILDPDEGRATDSFSRFCELTASLDIRAGLEFMAFSPLTKTLDDALRVIARSGHPNSGLTLDALHLMRNGSTPADLAKVAPAMISYVQICDGPLTVPPDQQFAEALENRQAPGEGTFPLCALIKALDPAVPLALEVPMNARRDRQGMAAIDRARLLMATTRQLLASVDAAA
jgi:sugar phosphate isomerase/epimerase